MGEIIEGSVERVVFHSDETGFTVIRVRPDESADIPGENLDSTGLFTVVGQLPAIKPGELLRFDGVWMRHKTFGKQLRITSYQPVSPKTLEGIERHLRRRTGRQRHRHRLADRARDGQDERRDDS